MFLIPKDEIKRRWLGFNNSHAILAVADFRRLLLETMFITRCSQWQVEFYSKVSGSTISVPLLPNPEFNRSLLPLIASHSLQELNGCTATHLPSGLGQDLLFDQLKWLDNQEKPYESRITFGYVRTLVGGTHGLLDPNKSHSVISTQRITRVSPT